MLAGGAAATAAHAEALLLVDIDSGKVLHAENATYPWYPASLSKLMTLYLTLHALKDGRITPDTVFTVSPNAMAQQPSKMGFPVGTQVTVDNAIKMLMVHSANDMAVLLAEGIGGSIDGFAEQMNQAAQRLGMTQTHYVNPNGLPAEEQYTSARDLAMLARALNLEFPEYHYYWDIPAIKFGRRVMRNTNSMLGRYPGIDGMKTGFICASGFNLVASATRDGKHLLAVVLGAPSSEVRSVKAAQLLERGFNGGALSWLTPSLGSLSSLAPINAAPADLHDETCGKHRRRPAAEEVDEEEAGNGNSGDSQSLHAFMLSNLGGSTGKPSQLLGPRPEVTNPVVVYAGLPHKQQAALAATGDMPHPARKHAKPAAPAAGQKPARSAKVEVGETAKSKTTTGKASTAKPTEAKPMQAKPTATKSAAAAKAGAKPHKRAAQGAEPHAQPSTPQQ